jgi:hypothetical protein
MHTRRSRISLVVVVASLSVVGAVAVGHAQSPRPTVAGGTFTPRSNVSELITYVPPTTTSIAFTDWGRIKASQDAEGVTGASPVDDKMQVVLSTNDDEAAASGFGIARLRDHFDTWGWDTLDLEWEATIGAAGPPLSVLRFRDGFDLAPVIARFDERGFTSESVPGGVIRSHEMDVGDDWLMATEFAILNTAFLDDGRTLVLSVDPDQVRDVATTHGRFPSLPGLEATAAALDGASAGLLIPDVGACIGFTPLPVDIGDPFASPDLSFPTRGLHPYAALGIGYARPDWAPMGRIVFGYLDGATAGADLAGRRTLAETGFSERVGQPIADALFTVADGHVDGATLSLEVAPVDDRPRRLLDMVFTRDMVFAGC